MDTVQTFDTLLIGCGLSGIAAATTLTQAGQRVIILDKGRGPGGRMATRISHQAVFDHGCQYITAQTDDFKAFLQPALSSGQLMPWYHASYCHRQGMRPLAQALVQDLIVHYSQTVTSIAIQGDTWQVNTQNTRFNAKSLIITAPVPQSLALLNDSHIPLSDQHINTLSAVRYLPCLALLIELDGPSQVAPPGGLKTHTQPIAWVADNHQKGLTQQPGCLTVHTSPEFSQSHFEDSPEQVWATLKPNLGPYIGSAEVARWQLHRWRYAQVVPPNSPWKDAYYPIHETPICLLAGDAFGGGAKVESAYISGKAAAERVIQLNISKRKTTTTE